MKRFLQRVHGWIIAARHWVSTARKAVVPIVAAVVGFLSLPELGIDPDVTKAIVAIVTTLGVYQATNVSQDPADHRIDG